MNQRDYIDPIPCSQYLIETVVEIIGYDSKNNNKYKAINLYLKSIAGFNQVLRLDSDSLSFHNLGKKNK